MAAKLLVLFACVALSCAALVKRETSNVLQDIEKHATEFQKTFSEEFKKVTNSENTEQFNKVLKEGSDSVLQQLSAFSNSLTAALSEATGKAKEALEASKASLERSAAELRAAHPDLEQNAVAFKDKLQAAVQNTVQESQKLAKEVSANIEKTNANLAPKIQEAYDDFVKQAQEVQKKLHEAATKQ